ncbi:MAG: Arc family DNA-binding protein [Rhodocyclaceae bacterium]|nr:Arc family DNA-binding protein [Rhodocyclaceae bacterium]
MADLTIRGLPDELHQQLKQLADAHHRSVNRETIVLIERAMAGDLNEKPRLSATEVIAKAQHFASLPVLDGRSADELIGYDVDGLPR